MTDVDERLNAALNIFAHAKSERQWLRAANTLRGICHQNAGLACPACQGQGVQQYGNTSTWRGGIGGQSFTEDVCDVCWGTGRTDTMGTDLRKLTERNRALENEHGREASAQWLAAKLGLSLGVVRASLPPLVHRLRRLRGVEFWTARLCDILADAIEEMAKEGEA